MEEQATYNVVIRFQICIFDILNTAGSLAGQYEKLL